MPDDVAASSTDKPPTIHTTAPTSAPVDPDVAQSASPGRPETKNGLVFRRLADDGDDDSLNGSMSLVASTSSLEQVPVPPKHGDDDDKPVKMKKKRPPPPRKGILKEPSVSTSRFSFRRDVVQPFTSSAYGNTTTTSTTTARAPLSASQNGVVGNAASIAGGLWGNAMRRLGGSAPLAGVLETMSPSPSAPVVPRSDEPVHASTSAPKPPSDPLKKVSFRMSALKVVYPINDGTLTPTAPWQEKRTRRRINRDAREKWRRDGTSETRGWTSDELFKLYYACCKAYEEPGIERLRVALSGTDPPKTIDLSNELLTAGAVEALADVLAVDFGLKKLVLDSCGLSDDSLKTILHALLISASVPHISLAGNKRIRSRGWTILAKFVAKAPFLKHLDVSETSIDRRAVEQLTAAFSTSATKLKKKHDARQSSTVASLGDDEQAQVPAMEPRQNDGGHETAEEESDDEPDRFSIFYDAPLLRSEDTSSASLQTLRLENCGMRGATLEALAKGVRTSSSKHISLRRNRINTAGAVHIALMIRDYPISADDRSIFAEGNLTTSPSTRPPLSALDSSNSVTAREGLSQPYRSDKLDAPAEESRRPSVEESREEWENLEARLRLQRQIQDLPRIGSLLTLDLKNNDLRNGVGYVAQVLKRNRTLRVLNLSENKVDVHGLVAIAEALRYNTTLETLDMSLNPCCGPTIEGVVAMRAAITFSRSIKRVFLNSTGLTSEGAIALAEFLPEANSVLHLDLTGNHNIDIAGVLALSVSIKMNRTIRCLDLNIPPNSDDFAQLSQDILQSCVRNTELAQNESLAKGHKAPVAAPIHRSTVAQALASHQERSERRKAQAEAMHRSNDEILKAADECYAVLDELLRADEAVAAKGVLVKANDLIKDLLVQAQLAEAQLMEAVAITREGEQRRHAEQLGDKLSAILDRAKELYEPSSLSVDTSSLLQPQDAAAVSPGRGQSPVGAHTSPNGGSTPARRLSPQPADRADEPSSPAFSIADSDDESFTGSPIKKRHTINASARSAAKAGASDVDEHTRDQDEVEMDLAESVRSPVESQSRTYALEEAEVFRKGTALGTADDEDVEEVSGEALKQEILHTPVERTVRRASNDSLNHVDPV